MRLVLSKETSAIDKMVHVLGEDEFWKTHILTPAEAKLWADANTLAIVCDTHRTPMVAAPEALEVSERTHCHRSSSSSCRFCRKSIAYVFRTCCLIYKRASYRASSICGVPVKLSKAEATGIYAGIVLVRRIFISKLEHVLLKRQPFYAEQGRILKRLNNYLLETFDSIQLRAKIVFEANRTEGIAISVAPEGLKDMMALAAQSADMLISNEDIEAAFVLYPLNDGGIGVSARSKGKVNVQVVMESLGGGGHRTVAGANYKV